jgi:hypothetical protein
MECEDYRALQCRSWKAEFRVLLNVGVFRVVLARSRSRHVPSFVLGTLRQDLLRKYFRIKRVSPQT